MQVEHADLVVLLDAMSVSPSPHTSLPRTSGFMHTSAYSSIRERMLTYAYIYNECVAFSSHTSAADLRFYAYVSIQQHT